MIMNFTVHFPKSLSVFIQFQLFLNAWKFLQQLYPSLETAAARDFLNYNNIIKPLEGK